MGEEIERSEQQEVQSGNQNVPSTQTHVHQVSAPGEWVLQKLFGPSLDALGTDLHHVYEAARNKILNAALKKTPNIEDGKTANVRVAHGVLSGGAFSDSEICAEYFGGILAAARTDEGRNDDAIQFVEVTKALSSRQLHLHYVIYNRLNKLFVGKGTQVNVGMDPELKANRVWFSYIELANLMKLKPDTDLNILFSHGLISEYGMQVELRDNTATPYAFMSPSTFGVLLYAVSHNRYSEWKQFSESDFGDYDGIALPSIYTSSLEDLIPLAALPVFKSEETA